MTNSDVVFGERALLGEVLGAVGIEPAVELEAAFVGFGDREFEWVVGWLWRLALETGEVFGPRFEARGVEGVGRRADLQYDRV